MTQAAAQPTIVKYPRTLVVDAVVNPNAAGAPNNLGGQQVLTVPQDADFEWWWLAAFRTSFNLKVQVQESATTRYMVYSQSGNPQGQGNSAFLGIYIDLFAGLVSNNGAFPQTVPYVMPAGRNYVHSFTDLSGAANTVELAYIGYAMLQFQPGAGGGQSSS
jgi:hypothetical protein